MRQLKMAMSIDQSGHNSPIEILNVKIFAFLFRFNSKDGAMIICSNYMIDYRFIHTSIDEGSGEGFHLNFNLGKTLTRGGTLLDKSYFIMIRLRSNISNVNINKLEIQNMQATFSIRFPFRIQVVE